MGKNDFSRREFLQVGAGAAAAAVVSTSILGHAGGELGEAGSSSAGKAWSYHGQHGITAVFQPTNLSLYRQLLPAAFEMPDSPQVIIAIVSYTKVNLPLVPYHEGYVMLACNYQGKPGLHTITIPVDNLLACNTGRSIGYPKYVADKIKLTQYSGGWKGEVIYQGNTVMMMTFMPHGTKVTDNLNNPGPTNFNIVPVGVGPQVLAVDIIGHQLVKSRSGSATVTVDPAEPWGNLLEGATLVSAQSETKTGGWILQTGDEPTTAVVSIARIRNGRIDLAVEEAIDLLGGIAQVTLGKQKIMLKPNLVGDNKRSTTKLEVVRTLAQLMQGAGKEVVIGEGSATANGYNIIRGEVYRTKNQTILNGMQQHVFHNLRYDTLGIPLINLHTGDMTTVAVPNGFVFDEITIHKSLSEIDMLCSVPMMKTHMLGKVTLGMKNLIRLYPGSVYETVRSLVHDEAAKVEGSGVAAAVIDMVRANKLGLVVVDGSMAMEGNGPENGTLIKMNLIIAGTNPLATDMVAAMIMGYYPVEIPTFLWANDAGMQPQRMTQIEIKGESIANVQRKFARPKIVPWSMARTMFGTKELP
ncbi:MAG TPA: DUF362 domain-containing protein [Geobacteraceae bacterium]|nr:DUF362 domain-containing protein [Geobacteraceae bacterium]